VSRNHQPTTIAGMLARARSESLLLRAEMDAYPRAGWRQRVPCSGLPVEIFYENDVPGVCHGCPVRVDCVADALRHEWDELEVFGARGIPADHRDRWRRARRREGVKLSNPTRRVS
jgi:hypothetical protein